MGREEKNHNNMASRAPERRGVSSRGHCRDEKGPLDVARWRVPSYWSQGQGGRVGVRREGRASPEPPSQVWWCREGERRGHSSQDGGNERELLDREVGTGVAEGVGENSIGKGMDAAPSETGGGRQREGRPPFSQLHLQQRRQTVRVTGGLRRVEEV